MRQFTLFCCSAISASMIALPRQASSTYMTANDQYHATYCRPDYPTFDYPDAHGETCPMLGRYDVDIVPVVLPDLIASGISIVDTTPQQLSNLTVDIYNDGPASTNYAQACSTPPDSFGGSCGYFSSSAGLGPQPIHIADLSTVTGGYVASYVGIYVYLGANSMLKGYTAHWIRSN